MTVYQYLHHLALVTVKLQGRTQDVIHAYNLMTDVKKTYEHERKNVDLNYDTIFEKAKILAEKVGICVSKPRTIGRQRHRDNAPAETPLVYYKRNVAVPFLDHIIVDLNEQFSALSNIAIDLLCLVPSCLENATEEKFKELTETYKDDLPNPQVAEREFVMWQTKFKSKPLDELPSTCAQAIRKCDRAVFPNIHRLFQLACTIPVTSCECERSASSLRRLHSYLRTSMTQERLSSLALIHIHYDTLVNMDEVVTLFSQQHPRKLKLSNVFVEDCDKT